MRRRRSINVWPAFADLMTVLAVGSLFAALAISWDDHSEDIPVERLRKLQVRIGELTRALETAESRLQVRENEWSRERENWILQAEALRREAARNEQMFQAIQAAQQAVDEISRSSGLTFGADQSLQFGDDLVTFRLNSVEPIWNSNGRERLRRFCQAISDQLADRESLGQANPFIVQIEGHTDSLGCPGDPNCNWWISSGRAASFLAKMKKPVFCPGGGRLVMRPIGFADTRPSAVDGVPTRRIAVRIVPDYERIISSMQGKRSIS